MRFGSRPTRAVSSGQRLYVTRQNKRIKPHTYVLSLVSRLTLLVAMLSLVASRTIYGQFDTSTAKSAFYLVDLGTLPGRTHSYAVDLNDRGDVVGFSDRETDPIDRRAFLWRSGKMVDLGTLGGHYSQAIAINNRGQVIGMSADKTSSVDLAFLWDNGRIIDLGAGEFFIANAINDHGQVVGTDYSRAFIWESGIRSELPGITAEARAEAFDINNRGQIVGFSINSIGEARAVMWENGTVTDLGVPGAALRINDRGQIIGWFTKASGESQAFFWDRGRVTEIGLLGTGTGWWPGSVVWGVNKRGAGSRTW